MAKAYGIEPQTLVMATEKTSLFVDMTFWLNVLMPVFMLLAMRGLSVSLEDQIYIVTAVMALSNIVVRFVTEHGVYLVSPPAPPPPTLADMELVAEKVVAERLREINKTP